MRRIPVLLLVLVLFSSPSWASSKVQFFTVAQLGQWLTSMHGQPDGKIAKDLESTVVTERVSVAQLDQWLPDLPGRHSRDALTALADLSIFLPLPPADVLSDPPPDIKTQGAIFSRAIDYVVQTLGKLPDLSATRTTVHFEDTPSTSGSQQLSQTAAATARSSPFGYSVSPATIAGVTYHQGAAAKPLHSTGESTVPVSYSSGVEMHGAEKMDRAAINNPESGLNTAGEFGPILSLVLDDAYHGTLDWGYWQQSSLGKLAVFRYKVEEGQSNYVVALKHGIRQERLFPAYHGEIVIDPVTGAVLRITLLGSALRSQYIMESAITVDYASVALGGKNYICPVKGIALLRTTPDSSTATGLHTQINDAAFTDYHLTSGAPPSAPATATPAPTQR